MLLFIGIIALIHLCRTYWPGGVQPGGVILCIVLFSTPVHSYLSYAVNRIFDTAVCLNVALLVNWVLQKDRQKGFVEEIISFLDHMNE